MTRLFSRGNVCFLECFFPILTYNIDPVSLEANFQCSSQHILIKYKYLLVIVFSFVLRLETWLITKCYEMDDDNDNERRTKENESQQHNNSKSSQYNYFRIQIFTLKNQYNNLFKTAPRNRIKCLYILNNLKHMLLQDCFLNKNRMNQFTLIYKSKKMSLNTYISYVQRVKKEGMELIL